MNTDEASGAKASDIPPAPPVVPAPAAAGAAAPTPLLSLPPPRPKSQPPGGPPLDIVGCLLRRLCSQHLAMALWPYPLVVVECT